MKVEFWVQKAKMEFRGDIDLRINLFRGSIVGNFDDSDKKKEAIPLFCGFVISSSSCDSFLYWSLPHFAVHGFR